VVLQLAVELGAGSRVQVEFITDDALNPYAPWQTNESVQGSLAGSA
jgi:hypothetical protein